MKNYVEKFNIKQVKFMVAAFWLCIIASLGPAIFQEKISNLCLIERTIFTLLGFMCFFGKWILWLKNIAIAASIALSTLLSLHIFATLNLLTPQVIAWINSLHFLGPQRYNTSCDQVNKILVISLFIIVICVAYLIDLSKKK